MVERTAADDGAEEGLLPPRRTDEKQAISDVTPASDRWPSADASAHVETDAAPDDDEPQPWRLTPAAKSERVEQSDADRSRTSGKASPNPGRPPVSSLTRPIRSALIAAIRVRRAHSGVIPECRRRMRRPEKCGYGVESVWGTAPIRDFRDAPATGFGWP